MTLDGQCFREAVSENLGRRHPLHRNCLVGNNILSQPVSMNIDMPKLGRESRVLGGECSNRLLVIALNGNLVAGVKLEKAKL